MKLKGAAKKKGGGNPTRKREPICRYVSLLGSFFSTFHLLASLHPALSLLLEYIGLYDRRSARRLLIANDDGAKKKKKTGEAIHIHGLLKKKKNRAGWKTISARFSRAKINEESYPPLTTSFWH